jgi:predicted ferric reductase
MMHGIVYVTTWAKEVNLGELKLTHNIVGMIAFFSMLTILITSLFLRKMRYEAFYVIHILFSFLILIVAAMHRMELSDRSVIAIIFTASLCGADRMLRMCKISLYGFGNKATITSLPHGGTRIVLRKSPGRAVAGSHCFLWIPTIRGVETHPFTVISTNPLEFVVAAYDGFTSDLHNFALKNPGKALTASIDGPYGSVPDFTGATKVIFIVGGSGASFSLGVALDLLRKLGSSNNTSIEVIWAIRHQGKYKIILNHSIILTKNQE